MDVLKLYGSRDKGRKCCRR